MARYSGKDLTTAFKVSITLRRLSMFCMFSEASFLGPTPGLLGDQSFSVGCAELSARRQEDDQQAAGAARRRLGRPGTCWVRDLSHIARLVCAPPQDNRTTAALAQGTATHHTTRCIRSPWAGIECGLTTGWLSKVGTATALYCVSGTAQFLGRGRALFPPAMREQRDDCRAQIWSCATDSAAYRLHAKGAPPRRIPSS